MEDLEKTLLNTVIKGKWNLTGDLKKADVTFTRSVWRAESGGGLETPRVEVSHDRSRRVQESDEFFEYSATVTLRVWSKGSDDDAITEAKDLKWKMIEEVKRIVSLYKPKGETNLPTGWDHMLVVSMNNGDLETLAHPLLAEAITITIRHFWEPS